MIDRKLEPLVKRQMTKYLGELEDDDLIMFVLEHLKDHKTPQKLVEGLEPVRRYSFLQCCLFLMLL
jgi:RNA-binding protein 25